MNLSVLFANAPEEDLSLRAVINPTQFNPKKMYADLYFDGLSKYRSSLKGMLCESGLPSIYMDSADFHQKNAMKIKAGRQNQPGTWYLASAQSNLKPEMTAGGLVVVLASMVSNSRMQSLNDQGKEVLNEWVKFLQFVENEQGSSNRRSIAVLIGHCRTLDEKITNFLAVDPRGREEVLPFIDELQEEMPDLTRHYAMILNSSELLQALESGVKAEELENEDQRLEQVTRLAASLTQNLLIIGPPGTGKTYLVQRSISHIPVVQVSLEGSTEPETVVANIAQTPDGKFQAFLAEAAKALKLGMLLAIVERLRQGRALSIVEENEADVLSLIGKLPKDSKLKMLLPTLKKTGQARVSDDLRLILNGIAVSLSNENQLQAWLSFLDAYADPFALDRWDEILFVYQNLEAHAVGTTCVLNIEEIYHAVENRKILDLLINLMAGQKKLPLSKAGVVGGDLYGHNVSVFATGNPLQETYLPQALESRFGLKEFLGYPEDVEEKKRMRETLEEYQNPKALNLNLTSTRLDDFPNAVPLTKKTLTCISDELRDKIYNLVNWTRSMFDNQELRNCACPRTAKMWELLTSAFMAEGLNERDALLLAVKSSVIGLVSIDHKGEPDPEGLKNIFQQVESYFLT